MKSVDGIYLSQDPIVSVYEVGDVHFCSMKADSLTSLTTTNFSTKIP